MTEKRCRGCGLVKALDLFPPQPDGIGGRHSRCRDCDNAAHRTRYQPTGRPPGRPRRLTDEERRALGYANYRRHRQKLLDAGLPLWTASIGICGYCTAPFRRSQAMKHYCSEPCQKRGPLMGAHSAIRITDCDVCGRPFTMHGGRGAPRKRCSDECRLTVKRTAMRDHQRRTHGVAIKYWTVDDSPAARDVARLYFELRTELRNRRAG